MNTITEEEQPQMVLFIKKPEGQPFFACYENKEIRRMHFNRIASGIPEKELDSFYPEGSSIQAKFMGEKVSVRFRLPHTSVDGCIISVGNSARVKIMDREFIFYVRTCVH